MQVYTCSVFLSLKPYCYSLGAGLSVSSYSSTYTVLVVYSNAVSSTVVCSDTASRDTVLLAL